MLFNASEKKGILVILLLASGLIVIPRQFRPQNHDFFLLPIETEIFEDSIVLKNRNEKVAVNKAYLQKQLRRKDTLELNTADSSQLVRVKGIGPYYAQKIIGYRERLGGYYSPEQLAEIKMTYFHPDSCGTVFTANPAYIQLKRLDSMTFKEILRHPYLNYEEVQLIFKAGEKYGRRSYQLLEEKKILPARTLKKIKPYFK